MGDEDPVRFGAEFGPHRTKRASGVSLSTFKTLVGVSNLGGLILFALLVVYRTVTSMRLSEVSRMEV